MTITAKFSTICPVCGQRITTGQQVNWTRGSAAQHVSCPSAVGGSRDSLIARASRGDTRAMDELDGYDMRALDRKASRPYDRIDEIMNRPRGRQIVRNDGPAWDN